MGTRWGVESARLSRRGAFRALLSWAWSTWRALLRSRDLTVVMMRPGLRSARHVVVMVIRDEADLMQDFLRYHRRLGFDHVIVIDNMSLDGTPELLAQHDDVSLVRADGSFKEARFGNDWANYVATRFCRGKWVLFIDADERLVFPHCDSASVGGLTDHLASQGRSSLVCLMLDMYSDGPTHQNTCAPGEDPLTVCALYDRTGYVGSTDDLYGPTWVKGGVRGRVFFSDDVWSGPALNKTALVRWGLRSSFVRSSHLVLPRHANLAGDVTGALLHFKFLSRIAHKVAEESARQQHTDEYDRYGGIGDVVLVGAQTARFEGWESLADDGLIDGRGWAAQS